LEHRECDGHGLYVLQRDRVQPRHHDLELFQCLVVEQHVSECHGVACWLQEDCQQHISRRSREQLVQDTAAAESAAAESAAESAAERYELSHAHLIVCCRLRRSRTRLNNQVLRSRSRSHLRFSRVSRDASDRYVPRRSVVSSSIFQNDKHVCESKINNVLQFYLNEIVILLSLSPKPSSCTAAL